MRVNYLAESIIPSRSANSIHVMNMCTELANLGHQVQLIVPVPDSDKQERGVSDVFNFYGVKNNFKIIYHKIPKVKGGFYLKAIRTAIFCKTNCDMVYSRDFWGSVFTAFFGIPTIHEFHRPLKKYGGLKGIFSSKFKNSKTFKKAVVISNALKEIFIQHGFDDHKLIVAHDAASIPTSSNIENVLQDNYHVGYVGHLYKGRGVELIFKMAKLLPDVTFDLIGGNEVDIEYHKSNNPSPNLVFHGFLAPASVNSIRSKMNVLIAPYQKEVGIWGGIGNTVDFMSPLKIFEYMSSKRPIISSDLPVLREVLNEENAILCAPELEMEWVDAINKLKRDESFSNQIAAKAYNDFISLYTWNQRAKYILEKVNE